MMLHDDEHMNRLLPSERYLRDAAFRALVDALASQIINANYTPTELREAVMLAAIQVENLRMPSPIIMYERKVRP